MRFYSSILKSLINTAMSPTVNPPRRVPLLLLAATTLILPGCADGVFGDLGGLARANKPPQQQTQPTNQPQRDQAGQNSNSDIFANLLAFNAPAAPKTASGSPYVKPLEEPTLYCPTIDVPDDTSYFRASHGVTGQDVEHQFSLADVARECQRQGSQIALKVGVAGRLLLGPSGKAGHFSAPVRIAIRRDGDQTVAFSKLYTVEASLAEGQASTGFQLVTEPILIPYLRPEADQDYTILIGFDSKKKEADKPKIANTEPVSRINRAGLGIGSKTGLEELQKKKDKNSLSPLGN